MFASEIKAFQAHEIDGVAMAARLVWEYPLDGTALRGSMSQTEDGRTVTDSGSPVLLGVANIERQALAPSGSWNPTCRLESFDKRLMADVPVGIVLSGGLDSSLVAAVAHEAAERFINPCRVLDGGGKRGQPRLEGGRVVASHATLSITSLRVGGRSVREATAIVGPTLKMRASRSCFFIHCSSTCRGLASRSVCAVKVLTSCTPGIRGTVD